MRAEEVGGEERGKQRGVEEEREGLGLERV